MTAYLLKNHDSWGVGMQGDAGVINQPRYPCIIPLYSACHFGCLNRASASVQVLNGIEAVIILALRYHIPSTIYHVLSILDYIAYTDFDKRSLLPGVLTLAPMGSPWVPWSSPAEARWLPDEAADCCMAPSLGRVRVSPKGLLFWLLKVSICYIIHNGWYMVYGI